MTDASRLERMRAVLAPTSPEPIGLSIASAEGVYVHTRDRRRYLDLTAGIGVANLGHGRPEIAEAVARQLARHTHVMVYGEYEQEAQTAFAAALVDLLPEPIEQVFPCCTGTEAIEGAIKIARKHTGRRALVAFERSYHGDTMGALSIQGSERYRRPFAPLLEDVTFLPFDAVDALDAITTDCAAVIVEPVQGEGGIRVPAAGFLPALRARCDAMGALLVFDEVITGFGRTGRDFAMQHWSVVPDLVCLAKAMGGGLPLGGIAGAREVMRTISHDPPLSHVTTFGGHPVSCAAGLAGLRLLREENLSERAAVTGRVFLTGLEGLVGSGGVRAARGIGLLLALEFDDAARTRRFVERSLERGLLLGWTLHCDDVVRITPPLVLERAHVDDALDRMRDALAD